MNFDVFSSRLKRLRNDAGLTQAELAEKVSVTKATISNLENAHKTPSLETIILIADCFGVSLDYLLGREMPYLTPIQVLEFMQQTTEELAAIEALRKERDERSTRLEEKLDSIKQLTQTAQEQYDDIMSSAGLLRDVLKRLPK